MMRRVSDARSLERASTQTSPIRLRQILVTTDFSQPSRAAIPYALAVSDHFGAELHLFHVVDTTQYASKSLLLPLISPAELSRPLLNKLQGIALKYASDGSIHVMKPREGPAYEEICNAARRLNAGLIVIATHGFSGLKHLWLGSTAEHIIRHSPCPVLVVRQRHRRFPREKIRLQKIVVPLDFSECSKLAFDCAIRLADDFRAQLVLAHVIDPLCYPFGDEYAGVDSGRLMEEARASARAEMNKMAAQANARCLVRIREGSPAREICNLARRDVDLIVTSTHGRTGLGHVLIGSVAERVVRHATCPVLVIPLRGKQKIAPIRLTKPARSMIRQS